MSTNIDNDEETLDVRGVIGRAADRAAEEAAEVQYWNSRDVPTNQERAP